MQNLLKQLGISEHNKGVSTGTNWLESGGPVISSYSPVDGKKIGEVASSDHDAYDRLVKQAEKGFQEWKKWP